MRKMPKMFLDLWSSLKVTGIGVTTHSRLIDMKNNNMMI